MLGIALEHRTEKGMLENVKRKEKVSFVPKPEVQPWQAQGFELLYVVSAEPGRANENQLAWEACMVMMQHSPTVPKRDD